MVGNDFPITHDTFRKK